MPSVIMIWIKLPDHMIWIAKRWLKCATINNFNWNDIRCQWHILLQCYLHAICMLCSTKHWYVTLRVYPLKQFDCYRLSIHNDGMTWKRFPHYWHYSRIIPWSSVNSHHKESVSRRLIFFFLDWSTLHILTHPLTYCFMEDVPSFSYVEISNKTCGLVSILYSCEHYPGMNARGCPWWSTNCWKPQKQSSWRWFEMTTRRCDIREICTNKGHKE